MCIRDRFPAYVFLDLTNADEVFYELKRIPEFSKLLGDNLGEFIPLEEEERKFFELLDVYKRQAILDAQTAL